MSQAPFTSEVLRRGNWSGSVQSAAWKVERGPDPEKWLSMQLASWLKDVAESEEVFRQHVYENKDVTQMDFRQHRASLFAFLSDGENLAIGYTLWAEATKKEKEALAAVNLLDEKLAVLRNILWKWHGPLEAQSDVPESFKQGAKEADEGKIVDLDL
jgi:hypothetical protein